MVEVRTMPAFILLVLGTAVFARTVYWLAVRHLRSKSVEQRLKPLVLTDTLVRDTALIMTGLWTVLLLVIMLVVKELI